jgi:hypothetical protein
MTDSIRTYKQFYKHSETESIYAIERRLDGTLIGSCGPLPVDDLKSPDKDFSHWPYQQMLSTIFHYNYMVELNVISRL